MESIVRIECGSTDWLGEAYNALEKDGIFVAENALSDKQNSKLLSATQAAIDSEFDNFGTKLGHETYRGATKLPLLHDDCFLELLEEPHLVSLVDTLLSPNAVLRYQQGFYEDCRQQSSDTAELPQFNFHMNYPFYLNGYRAALNLTYSLSGFEEESSPRFVVGSQRAGHSVDSTTLEEAASGIKCKPGSVLVYDGSLWHHDIPCPAGHHRGLLDHLFIRHFLQPYYDYPRALGQEKLESLSEKTQQYLGYHSRLPASLDEFLRPPEKRLYRISGE